MLAAPLGEALRREAPDLAVFDVRSVDEHVGLRAVPARYVGAILGALGAFGFAIAMVGLYALTAFVVASRRREFGTMRALGAQSRHLYSQALREGVPVMARGLAPGVFGALVVALFARHVLYGVPPYDPLTFLAVPVAVLGVSMAAWLVPIARATRIDPAEALRDL